VTNNPADNTAEQVTDRDAPYGHCSYCGAARSKAGCLNLCEMPAGLARKFNNGLHTVIAAGRVQERQLELIAGCTCPPATLHGYQTRRDYHQYRCPLAERPAR